ncbi:maleylpyruvate isomerase N-terminal domain-containing protein [Streptomyces sp. ODS28]|uniref:maleylpyruvate isomerase N-terminal domain-containing protein n=1 Tax=Streptomyces sp. ODS28 TaxID=3136688 RepID=UPI0031EE506B
MPPQRPQAGHPEQTGRPEHAGQPDQPPPPHAEDGPAVPEQHGRRDDRYERESQGHTGLPVYDHNVLKSLLGAWALAACSAEETSAIEAHLTDCAGCADEALRLRDAVGLLHPEDSLDLDPMLRARVLERCLDRRPARIPIPEWASPYDAETARLDALLRDMADAEWQAPVRLRWFEEDEEARRDTTVAGVLGHLLAVDGLVATVLGLDDPLGGAAVQPQGPGTFPTSRTEAYWRSPAADRDPSAVREAWREQGHSMVRTVSFAGRPSAGFDVSYGDFTLPLRDAFLDRAFECWVHAGDIAEAVDYPYELPSGDHLNLMVDLAARQLPGTIAGRRRAGLSPPPRRLGAAGAPGRTLHLEVEGSGGGHWYIPLDSPAAAPSPQDPVAHVALDGAEFCQLAAGHVAPQDAAAGQDGDREAIRDVLFAAASLSRL